MKQIVDRHKVKIDADLCGRLSYFYLDDTPLTDVKEFGFKVTADGLTELTITLFTDIELNGTLLSEYFDVRLVENHNCGFWCRLFGFKKKGKH